MKRMFRILYSVVLACTFALLGACTPDPFEPDPDMLTGTWRSGTEYYHYYANSWQYEQYGGTKVEVNGNVWDTSVDEGENEALPFKWTLDGADMLQVHYDYMGSIVPKTYTITDLTSTPLTYQDKYGRTYTYSKVK